MTDSKPETDTDALISSSELLQYINELKVAFEDLKQQQDDVTQKSLNVLEKIKLLSSAAAGKEMSRTEESSTDNIVDKRLMESFKVLKQNDASQTLTTDSTRLKEIRENLAQLCHDNDLQVLILIQDIIVKKFQKISTVFKMLDNIDKKNDKQVTVSDLKTFDEAKSGCSLCHSSEASELIIKAEICSKDSHISTSLSDGTGYEGDNDDSEYDALEVKQENNAN